MKKMFINGEFVTSLAGETFAVENPATEEWIDEVPRARAEDAEAAVRAAHAAWDDWRFTPGIEKCEMLHEAARRMREHREELAKLLTMEVGKPLVKHPLTPVIAFTGSVATGRRIATLAAERIKRVNLELGGNDPFIICDDADVDVAVRGAVWAAFLNMGQVCTSGERFYVFESISEKFIGGFVEFAQTL